MKPQSLYEEPNALAPHYSQFRVTERCLLTGHSHQAWPDHGFDGQRRAWQDAAHHVDEKWGPAFEQAELVRAGFRRLLGDDPEYGAMALGQNTHELLIRFLSALPLRDKGHVVTTDGEFHSMRRQLDRFEEEGLAVTRVAALPAGTLSQRMVEALDHRTGAVMVSAVLFGNAHIVPELDRLSAACRQRGVPLLVDAYHALNVVPFSMTDHDLLDAYVVGGGYKYCQLGEGNCFFRFPRASTMRPAVTGWFAEFADLTDSERDTRVAYGEGDARFAGATYDPTSHYRAADVFAFFEERGLHPDLLRDVSQHQVGMLAERFDALEADPSLITRDRSVQLSEIGGFLALETPHAAKFQELLRDREVWTDHRGNVLRLGPAPYLADRQLVDAVEALAETIEVVRSIA